MFVTLCGSSMPLLDLSLPLPLIRYLAKKIKIVR
jgi:hypothetical protein